MDLHDNTLFREQCYMDGNWIGAGNGTATVIANPASGEAIGSVPDMGRDETHRAISAARAALPGWSCRRPRRLCWMMRSRN